MNMDSFKPGQRRCVTTLDEPVVVSAGAGSGKTFTLTQRIAWALMPGSGEGGASFLDDIDQVLAITFTSKAAGEIKSRVKGTLAAEGRIDQALKVDDAWISTIHGMCSRMLRMYAVDLGLDPAFEVLGEADAQQLFDGAVDEVLAAYDSAGLAEEGAAANAYEALFSEFHAASRDAKDHDSVEAMVREFAQAMTASPLGVDCVVLPPQTHTGGELVRFLIEATEPVRDAAAAQKDSGSKAKYLASCDEALVRADVALSAGEIEGAALCDLVAAWPFPAANFGDADYKAYAKEAQAETAAIAQEVRLHVAQPALRELVALAGEVYEAYSAAKREAALLDNDDLLIFAARALRENERVRAAFADRFKLIMVDEFQDTDQLQVDMISAMAGAHGERLCTVGDAQQSIYRFRGADVSVYERHLARVQQADASMPIELPDNFRSHADVLKLVDRIFERREAFGDRFMSLAPSRNESKVKRPFKGEGSRVSVLCTTYPDRCGIDAADVRALEARRIAERFAELREAGQAAGDMVVLLGKMTNADAYAQALRDQGFACVIAGGSIFSRAPEVSVMRRLTEVIANPHGTQALFELLASDMFELSADDFIELSTKPGADGTGVYRRGIDDGLYAVAKAPDAGVSPRLAAAAKLVAGFAKDAGRVPVSSIMTAAVRDSGWLSRMEAAGAEGLSAAGNVLKAIRMVEDIEAAGTCGPASVARAFAATLDVSKQAPGALSASGGDFVRIMTVHASKGLEFPVVAVAEMERTQATGGHLRAQTIDGLTYVSLSPMESVRGYKSSSTIGKASAAAALAGREDEVDADFVRNVPSAVEFYEALRVYEDAEEDKERQRLLYVALTRAAEALVVSLRTKRSKEDDTLDVGGVYADVRRGLFGDGDIPEGESAVDFGGSMPARVSRYDAQPGEFDVVTETANADDAAQGAEPTPTPSSTRGTKVFAPADMPQFVEVPYASDVRADVTSYSSLAEAVHGAPAPEPVVADADDLFWDGLAARLASDADKATEVGSAFHALAQYAVQASAGQPAANRSLTMPAPERVENVAKAFDCASSVARINQALYRWFGSSLAARVAGYETLAAEKPFFIAFPQSDAPGAANAYLEGSIDLFAANEDGGDVLIVDYKTGGSPAETPEQLQHKHLLQAQCYAYATMLQGYASVEAVFVRVEVEGEPGQPQYVRYRFTKEDMPDLLTVIQDKYRG